MESELYERPYREKIEYIDPFETGMSFGHMLMVLFGGIIFFALLGFVCLAIAGDTPQEVITRIQDAWAARDLTTQNR